MPFNRFANILKHGCLFIAVFSFTCCAVFQAIRSQDLKAITQAVSGQLQGKPGSGLFVEEATHWVFRNKGFRRNQRYFLFKPLGATPRQVLETGGDCADKSRLLSTILRLRGVDSTLVTLYGCATCGPTHVVVEARYDKGWMVADPVFDMVFPKEGQTYYNLAALKANPGLLVDRLDQLVQLRGLQHPVSVYRRSNETYTWARYLNWDKLDSSRYVARLLAEFNTDLYQLRRPYFLEDPQLLLSGLAGLSGVTAVLAWLVFRSWAARLAVKPAAAPLAGMAIRPADQAPH